jgi:hypothetical protein
MEGKGCWGGFGLGFELFVFGFFFLPSQRSETAEMIEKNAYFCVVLPHQNPGDPSPHPLQPNRPSHCLHIPQRRHPPQSRPVAVAL